MKIGTITFHWATNYGAVFQSYALQQFLIKNEFETEIINYIPLAIKIKQNLKNILYFRQLNMKKENLINNFRKQQLVLSPKTYRLNRDLKKHCHDYDVYICGSDQIWNQSFTLKAEGKPTLSYFLDFVKKEKTRLSYAASFGTSQLNPKVVDLVKSELSKFDSISVRENTGKTIIENMGLQARLDVDPTLLLERDDYEKLLSPKKIENKFKLFSYILHKNQFLAEKINTFIFENFFDKYADKQYKEEPIDMLEWLSNVKKSKLVVTNSFHGAIFSIIFHTPFIIIPVENSGMNDRINTLLRSLGLESRLIDSFDIRKINTAMSEKIDWEEVDSKLETLRKQSQTYLLETLKTAKN